MTVRVVAAVASLLTCCAVGRGEWLTWVTAWQTTAIPPRTGQFTVEFDATPNEPSGNGIARVLPPMQTLVTSAGLTLVNTELLWIRSFDPAGTVDLVVGSSMDSVQASPELWLYFATSECLQWNEELFGCLDSEMQVALAADVLYDLVGWSEAEDRREPDREMLPIVDGWSFHPADVNMDGSVDCEDLSLFVSGPYDWNLDGEATDGDRLQLLDALAASRADVNGDGIVDSLDLLALLGSWGPCPPAGDCVTDLDCDGIVGIVDILLLMDLMGGSG